MDINKLIEALEERRDNYDRSIDCCDDFSFYQNVATVNAIQAVIDAVTVASEDKQ